MSGAVYSHIPGAANFGFTGAGTAFYDAIAKGGSLPAGIDCGTSCAANYNHGTVVTDAQGRYNIVDLRPGTYAVTFTLTGFTAVRRQSLPA